ncbi:hypothetical protein RQN30_00430 [Arcanobacterium hippocoleae]
MHPYTQALLSAIPIPDPKVEKTRERITLQGDLPSPTSNEPGCRFRMRCPLYQSLSADGKAKCDTETPLLQIRPNHDHAYACHYR